MKQLVYHVFETSLGWCGIAWAENGRPSAAPAVALFQLPEATAKDTESRMARSGALPSAAPPPAISDVIGRVCKHLHGDIQDFQDVAVDLDGAAPFTRRVYDAARRIPAGRTRTYGEIAKGLGRPNAARAVGQALARNPIALIIPCHRVLAAGGLAGGFSAYGGLATKARLLALEGAAFGPPRPATTVTRP
jgi:methylated-DNA-[protein]-cysteine S-methyltransferase